MNAKKPIKFPSVPTWTLRNQNFQNIRQLLFYMDEKKLKRQRISDIIFTYSINITAFWLSNKCQVPYIYISYCYNGMVNSHIFWHTPAEPKNTDNKNVCKANCNFLGFCLWINEEYLIYFFLDPGQEWILVNRQYFAALSLI